MIGVAYGALTYDTLQAHLPNNLYSKTTCVSRQQKGKLTIVDFNEARHNGETMASAGPCADHLHFATDRHASTSSINDLRDR